MKQSGDTLVFSSHVSRVKCRCARNAVSKQHLGNERAAKIRTVSIRRKSLVGHVYDAKSRLLGKCRLFDLYVNSVAEVLI